jgi:membrane-bound serine protease (ClpP class)
VCTAALTALLGVCVFAPAGPASGPATTSQADEARRETTEGWFAIPQPREDMPVLPAEVTRAYVIPIREEISVKTFDAFRRKARWCMEAKAQLVVIDMDTWGGQAIAGLDIAKCIKTDLNDVHTVCFVHTRGISAGALITVACDRIVMTPVGQLGDCAPILRTGTLEGVEREKMESELRAEFVESAERNGYPPALSESMVSITREVWLVRNKATRELRYVLRKDFAGKVTVPPGATTAPSNPDAEWEVLRVVVGNDELLTMTSAQAKEYGFVSDIVQAPMADPYADVAKLFHVQNGFTVLSDNWSEKLVHFLTSAPVMGFLLFVGLLCGYVEMHTPGFGVAGGIAIACFALLFGSNYLVGMATWWEIGLFFLGLALLAVEIFITPGFGVMGIAGIICCIVGLLGMIIPNAPDKLPIPTTALDWSIFSNGLMALIIGFLAAIVAAMFLGRYLPSIPLANRLLLAAPEIPPSAPAGDLSPITRIAPGAVGVVTGTCRPVGQVRFGDDLVDAVAEGEFIAPGAKVTVLKVEGNRVVVTPVA